MLVEICMDVVCPWCSIGKRQFERALARFPAERTSTSSFGALRSIRWLRNARTFP